MSAVKERIFGAVSVMNDSDAEIVWDMIADTFPKHSWDDIEVVEPDEWDLKMLKEIETNQDCQEFVSQEEAMREIGL
jgi:hypothetical protein